MVDRLTFKECCCSDFQDELSTIVFFIFISACLGRANTWPECTESIEVVVFGTDAAAAVGRFSVS